tara:strand:- start:3283 stop:3903 length:621 start_codon:yes stop_codon:yes gene_type:complete
MRSLVNKINKLRKLSINKIVNNRIKEFKQVKSNNKVFSELCFCILTANFNAERGIMIQNAIGSGFLTLTEKQLARKLKELGHRFPNIRAKYIIEARKTFQQLKKKLKNVKDEFVLREYIVKSIKGLGYKESSHFLRNIGYDNLAILDFHIIDLLVDNKVVDRPKTLTKNKYIEIEALLGKLAKQLNTTQSKLDLYLWYIETGKVLK